ncbi:MAG: HAD-IA family hydrolase [Rhodospirillaceae bacterium]|nr:HAD-IA family hydrolase [Rhodospirillaceae bacterium]
MTPGFDFSAIRALSFDCYGTLIDWETGLLRALQPLLQKANVSIEAALSAYAESEAREEARTPGKRYPLILEAVYRVLAQKWNVPVTDADVKAFGASVPLWPPFADSSAALKRLQSRFKLCILSNVDHESFAGTERALNVNFDLIVTAQDVGTYKPNLKNFRTLLDRVIDMDIAPHQVLHVAESLFHDHVPAQRLNLKTCWIDRRKGKGGGASAAKPVSVTPHLTFYSLAELADAAGV